MTGSTNIDNFRLVFDRSWNKCSPEMKEEYASQYAKCKQYLSLYLSVCLSLKSVTKMAFVGC